MIKSRIFIVSFLVLSLFISACHDKHRTGGVQTNPDPTRSLVSIAVTPDNPSIVVGATQQFTATGTYSDNTTQDLTASVTWSSSDASVTFGSTPGLATSTIAISDIIITATDQETSIHGTITLTVTEAGLVLYYIPGATADPATCIGSGTITDPYIGFCIPSVSGTVAAYLAPGAYDLTAVAGGVNLPNNWNLYGRTADYSAPVPLANRPVFSGIINAANGTISFNSIVMIGSNANNGILNTINTNVIIKNVNIENTAIGAVGIYISASGLNLLGTNNIVSNGIGGAAGSQGVYAENFSIINFSGTTNISGQEDSLFNTGLYSDSSTINFNGGTVSITGTGAVAANYGICINNSYANFNAGSVTISAIQGIDGYGIYALNSCYINYANSLASNSITINSNASALINENYGIFCNDGLSRLQIDGTEILSGASLDNFINFISSTSSSGNAVSWLGSTAVTRAW